VPAAADSRRNEMLRSMKIAPILSQHSTQGGTASVCCLAAPSYSNSIG
jgi:hypothetical protein